MSIFTNGRSNKIPGADSSDNKIFPDVIGSKLDGHFSNSLYSKSHRFDDHFHSPSDVYPSLDDDIQIQAAAGNWVLGNFTEIVPAGGITTDFDIHFVEISTSSANDVYELWLYAVETLILKTRFSRTTNQTRVAAKPTQSIIILANTQIKGKLACAGGGSKTANISIQFHPY